MKELKYIKAECHSLSIETDTLLAASPSEGWSGTISNPFDNNTDYEI